jgi:hypothetical protein
MELATNPRPWALEEPDSQARIGCGEPRPESLAAFLRNLEHTAVLKKRSGFKRSWFRWDLKETPNY